MQLDDPPLVFRFEPVGRLEMFEPMVLAYVDIVAHSLGEAYFSVRAMGMLNEHVRLVHAYPNGDAIHGKVAPHFVMNTDADDRPAVDVMEDGTAAVEHNDKTGSSVQVPTTFLLIDAKGAPMVQHLATPQEAQAAWKNVVGAAIMWRGAGLRLISSREDPSSTCGPQGLPK